VVSRVQVEVWVVNDGSMLRIRSVGTNPTPWFPKRDGHRRRLLRKGDCATLDERRSLRPAHDRARARVRALGHRRR
jgi:hypothetical protein